MNINTQSHYHGPYSLYKFAEDFNLNSYEFDIVKRIVRCRHKGTFIEDLKKTRDLINIYLEEQQDIYDTVTVPDALLDLQKLQK